jgi:hypothetical protein
MQRSLVDPQGRDEKELASQQTLSRFENSVTRRPKQATWLVVEEAQRSQGAQGRKDVCRTFDSDH